MSTPLSSLQKKAAKNFIEAAEKQSENAKNDSLTKRLNVEIPLELHRELKIKAAEEGCQIKDLVIKGINEILK